jgi:hypothetical protein
LSAAASTASLPPRREGLTASALTLETVIARSSQSR